MICNTCGHPMVKGYIPAMKTKLYWAPEEIRPAIFTGFIPQGGIQLTKLPMWTVQKALSFYCRECNIIVTPIPKKEEL